MSSTETFTRQSSEHTQVKQREAWTFVITSHAKTWVKRLKQRHEYESLLRQNPEILDDIGVTKSHLQREINKPFWRA